MELLNLQTGPITEATFDPNTGLPMTSNKQNLSKAEREAYALVGRVGGKATAKKLGKKYMSNIGKKGAAARWGNKKVSK